VEGFGFQWRTAEPVIGNSLFGSPEVFLDFIHPVQPAYVAEKVVLDAGCGSGRFLRCATRLGARLVVGVDLSDAVESAFETTRHLPNVMVVQADLLALPFQAAFDYAFSVGVLHHTAAPGAAFDQVVSAVRPGGGVSAWVYGAEGNAWITRGLTPLRRHVFSRLPRRAALALSYALAWPLLLVTKGIYGRAERWPGMGWLRGRLYYYDYLRFLSRFGLHEHAYIIFDHVTPAIAHYISRDDFLSWFERNGLTGLSVTSRNGNSWRGFGVRPEA
jgi:SAM-dependent methyltransferase